MEKKRHKERLIKVDKYKKEYNERKKTKREENIGS